MPKKLKRKSIEDKNVIHTWTCKSCGKTFEVTPDYYEENGTPVCWDCDRDCEYSKTEILV